GLVELLRVRHDLRRDAVQEGGLAAAGGPEDGRAGAPCLHHLQVGEAAPVEDLDLLDAELLRRDGAHGRSPSPPSPPSSALPLAASSVSHPPAASAALRNAASRRCISSGPTRGTTT